MFQTWFCFLNFSFWGYIYPNFVFFALRDFQCSCLSSNFHLRQQKRGSLNHLSFFLSMRELHQRDSLFPLPRLAIGKRRVLILQDEKVQARVKPRHVSSFVKKVFLLSTRTIFYIAIGFTSKMQNPPGFLRGLCSQRAYINNIPLGTIFEIR